MELLGAGAVRCAVLLCTKHRHSFAGKHFPQIHQGDFFQEEEQFTTVEINSTSSLGFSGFEGDPDYPI